MSNYQRSEFSLILPHANFQRNSDLRNLPHKEKSENICPRTPKAGRILFSPRRPIMLPFLDSYDTDDAWFYTENFLLPLFGWRARIAIVLVIPG